MENKTAAALEPKRIDDAAAFDFLGYAKEIFPQQEEYLGTDKAVNRIWPKLSVRVTTYNQADTIAQCLDSILMQKTSFPYEILIGEDGSDDGTREICKKYAELYPDRIRLILMNREQTYLQVEDEYSYLNGRLLFKACRGQYIAMCEGDDYWLMEDKLAHQVRYMEQHPICSLTFTSRTVLGKRTKEREELFGEVVKTSKDVVAGFVAPTQTMVLRNLPGLGEFLITNAGYPYGDRLLTYYCSLMGDLNAIPIVSAVYRAQGQGIWSRFDKAESLYRIAWSLMEFHRLLGIPMRNHELKYTVLYSCQELYKLGKDARTRAFAKRLKDTYKSYGGDISGMQVQWAVWKSRLK